MPTTIRETIELLRAAAAEISESAALECGVARFKCPLIVGQLSSPAETSVSDVVY